VPVSTWARWCGPFAASHSIAAGKKNDANTWRRARFETAERIRSIDMHRDFTVARGPQSLSPRAKWSGPVSRIASLVGFAAGPEGAAFFAGKVLSASKRLEGLLRLDARRCWNTARANIGWTFEVSDERRLPRKSMQASRHSKMQNEDQLRLVKYKYPPHRSTSSWSRRRPGAPPNVTGARRC